ncbi:MAG: hypothetical protein SWK90_10760 [Chloroflexota bacterium]|nr:hypothetical protein [Chloroflexota bacterium]
MDTFNLSNQVRLSISQALLLLYRYLTGIYALGDLSFVQFLGGYVHGKKHSLDGGHILTVSGNGIGELEKMLCLQWKFDHLETMAVSPSQMRIVRFLMDATPNEVATFFEWAQDCLRDYPNLQALLASPGLVAYWQQQCELWQSPGLKGHVQLFGGSPWDMPTTEAYDAILLSHAQQLLRDSDAKHLLSYLKPGGWLAVLMPVIFRPVTLQQQMPARFSDSPAVKAAKQRMRKEAQHLGYEMPNGQPVHIRWTLAPEDTAHVVSFSIASPLRSLLIGELLIYSLAAELPDGTRLALLESALADISPAAGAGTEALLILLAEKGV